MTKPELVLPKDSMPWGRWYERVTDQTAAAIAAQRNDLSSTGSQFNSRADVIEQQIGKIDNISTQYTYVIPEYQRSKAAGSFTDPNVIFESPTVTFNPPKPTGAYRVLLFCNMNAEQVAGTSNLDYAYTQMMVGDRVYSQPTLEENRAGLFTVQNMFKIASVSAWANVANGAPTTVKMGLFVEPFNARTVTFRNCSITAVYVGGI